MKLGELVDALGGCRLDGEPGLEIRGVATIELAEAGEVTFLSNPKYRRHLSTTRASAVILDHEMPLPPHLSGIRSDHPYLSFAHALSLFRPPPPPLRGIHPTAQIARSAELGADVTLGPFVVIGEGVRIGPRANLHSCCTVYDGAEIGADSILHSHSVVREYCRLGCRVVLQNHVTVGCDGFGYARQPNHAWYKIPQTGIVIIEDDVEIGAGSTIDRATIGATIIRRGTKIDNLVQIGHGSTVGTDTLLCAQVGLAGSTEVGSEVILGGQVGSAGHLKIGDRVVATAQTGIPASVPEGKVISGYPAIDNRDWLKSSAVFAQLPTLQREVRRLRQLLAELEVRIPVIAPDPPDDQDIKL